MVPEAPPHADHPRPIHPLPVFLVDDMAELLLGEAKLEQYLKEHPLRQGASPRGPRPQLTEVRKHLTAALDRGNLKVPGPGGRGVGETPAPLSPGGLWPGRAPDTQRGSRPAPLPFSGGDSVRGFSPRTASEATFSWKWLCSPQGSGIKLSGMARSSAWLRPTESRGASAGVP